MRGFIDVFGPVFLFAVFAVIAFSGLLLAVNAYKEFKCGSYAEVTGKQTQWAFMDECYIKTETGWLTKSEHKAVIVAQFGLSAVAEGLGK